MLPDPTPVGATEIAERAGVERATVEQWTRRHPDFPRPRWTVGGRPAWAWAEIQAWLAATGRAQPSDRKRGRGKEPEMAITTITSAESASTPIRHGGYTYDPEVDGADFSGFTAGELHELGRERGFDFSAHPRYYQDGAECEVTTRYTIAVGTEYAGWLASDEPSDLGANNLRIDNLGDGRVELSERVLDYLREHRSDEDDCYVEGPGVDAEGAPYPMRMWIGGMPHEVVAQGSIRREDI
jgi:predicted DNA-binding transcriptional regulator AlpA